MFDCIGSPLSGVRPTRNGRLCRLAIARYAACGTGSAATIARGSAVMGSGPIRLKRWAESKTYPSARPGVAPIIRTATVLISSLLPVIVSEMGNGGGRGRGGAPPPPTSQRESGQSTARSGLDRRVHERSGLRFHTTSDCGAALLRVRFRSVTGGLKRRSCGSRSATRS